VVGLPIYENRFDIIDPFYFKFVFHLTKSENLEAIRSQGLLLTRAGIHMLIEAPSSFVAVATKRPAYVVLDVSTILKFKCRLFIVGNGVILCVPPSGVKNLTANAVLATVDYSNDVSCVFKTNLDDYQNLQRNPQNSYMNYVLGESDQDRTIGEIIGKSVSDISPALTKVYNEVKHLFRSGVKPASSTEDLSQQAKPENQLKLSSSFDNLTKLNETGSKPGFHSKITTALTPILKNSDAVIDSYRTNGVYISPTISMSNHDKLKEMSNTTNLNYLYFSVTNVADYESFLRKASIFVNILGFILNPIFLNTPKVASLLKLNSFLVKNSYTLNMSQNPCILHQEVSLSFPIL
jgi:hypothetical protein